MEFQLIKTDENSLLRYELLLRTCFPAAARFSTRYVKWLYYENPAGIAVGFDAFEGDRLAAHYVCVPASLVVRGKEARALLSLNTATHPDFQGRGLFTKLASMTYEYGGTNGFECVYGVANASSTPGFCHKLGFELVVPLESRVGFGRLVVHDWELAMQRAAFRRLWSKEELRWRLGNPANPAQMFVIRDGVAGFHAATGKWGIRAYGEFPIDFLPDSSGDKLSLWVPRLFLGLFPQGTCRYGGYFALPESFKPSPLNLIYRNLRNAADKLDPEEVLFSFLDFDAY